MSARQPATAWVWRLLVEIPVDAVPESLRVTLLALATYANPDGSEAYPSGASIGSGLGLGDRAARERLARLDRAGLTIRTGTRSLGAHSRVIVRRIDRNRLEDLTIRTASQGAARPDGATEPNGTLTTSERHADDIRTASQGATTIPDHPRPSLKKGADEIGAPQSDDDQEAESVNPNQLSIVETDPPADVEIVEPFDDVWIGLVEVFGAPTEPTRSLYAKICRDLAKRGATASDVRLRAARLAIDFDGSSRVTPTSLWKHWPRYDGLISTLDERAIAEIEKEERWRSILGDDYREHLESGPTGFATPEDSE